MNYKNYIVTVVTFFAIGLVAYFISKSFDTDSVSAFFIIAGLLNTIAFLLLLAYNPVYGDMAKQDRVMSGFALVENEDKKHPNYIEDTGNSFVDSVGYGINKPNIAGLVLGVIFFLIGIII